MYCLAEFCRLCMKSGGLLINMYSFDDDRIAFYDKFKACFPDIIHDETCINWLICNTCTKKLTKSYEFREHCLNRDIIFKGYISQLKNSIPRNTPNQLKTLSVVIKNDPSLYKLYPQIATKPNSNHFDYSSGIQTIKVEPNIDPQIYEDIQKQDHESYNYQQGLDASYNLFKMEYSSNVKSENTSLCNELNDNMNRTNEDTCSKKHISEMKPTCSTQIDTDETDKTQQMNEIYFHTLEMNQPASDDDELDHFDLAKPFMCDECHKGFSRMDYLNMHKRMHSGEKPYVCNVCSKAFHRPDKYNRHMRTHTGIKPYACDLCHKEFARVDNLNTHRRTHTGEKPCVCDICGKGFAEIGALKRHLRTHTGEKPYLCGVCNQRYSSAGNLNQHKRLHTGEKPYICDVCNMGFAMACNLKKHKMKHTGEKPYVCDVCGKRFATTFNRKKHKCMPGGEK